MQIYFNTVSVDSVELQGGAVCATGAVWRGLTWRRVVGRISRSGTKCSKLSAEQKADQSSKKQATKLKKAAGSNQATLTWFPAANTEVRMCSAKLPTALICVFVRVLPALASPRSMLPTLAKPPTPTR